MALARGAEFPMRALFSSSAAALRRARRLLCRSVCWLSSWGAGSDWIALSVQAWLQRTSWHLIRILPAEGDSSGLSVLAD